MNKNDFLYKIILERSYYLFTLFGLYDIYKLCNKIRIESLNSIKEREILIIEILGSYYILFTGLMGIFAINPPTFINFIIAGIIGFIVRYGGRKYVNLLYYYTKNS